MKDEKRGQSNAKGVIKSPGRGGDGPRGAHPDTAPATERRLAAGFGRPSHQNGCHQKNPCTTICGYKPVKDPAIAEAMADKPALRGQCPKMHHWRTSGHIYQ